ncbi:hypothetical protein [Parapedobacter sp. DT-150]|uniref:hypothetical protein n=1 Tax=Parapedobacter sp. DT-150 TaxID=3396162 RepID=UPI003F1AC301
MKTMKSFNLSIGHSIRVAVWSILLAGSVPFSTGVYAQEAHAHAGSLAQLQGYYQLPNKVAFIAFELQGDTLFAKQLWDNNKTYPLIQIDETHFESKAEGYQIEFIKDSSGQFNQAKILGRIMSTRVDFDPTQVKQLSAQQLERLAGVYTLRDDSSLKISIQSSGGGLSLTQLWDKKDIAFTPRSETFFLNDDGTFPLSFLLENGSATQVTCFENDVWLKEK